MIYRRPSRLRRIAKWVGLGVFLAVVGTWVPSLWLTVRYFGTYDPSVLAGWGLVRIICVNIPFWLLVTGIPTAVLWYRDRRTHCPHCGYSLARYRRRTPPGHCQHCGYNLTGNESGVCPECATSVLKEANTA